MMKQLAIVLLALVCLSGCVHDVTVIPADGVDPRTGKPIIMKIGPDVYGRVYIYNPEPAPKGQYELSRKPMKYPEGWLARPDLRLPATQPTVPTP